MSNFFEKMINIIFKLETFADLLPPEPRSIDELTKEMSESTDLMILKAIQDEGLIFLGGRLNAIFNQNEPDNIKIDFKLYFQNKSGESFLKENFKYIESRLVNEESLNELRLVQKISFAVHAPESTVESTV